MRQHKSRHADATVVPSNATLVNGSVDSTSLGNPVQTDSGPQVQDALTAQSAFPEGGHRFSEISVEEPKAEQGARPPSGILLKLRQAVSEEEDTEELEADGIAQRVMGMSDEEIGVSSIGIADIRRKAASSGRTDHELSFEAGGSANVPAGVLSEGGRALDPAIRAFMEPRFGHDFSRVRVHTNSRAVASAQALDALAFTLGSDIAFGAGQYRPQSPDGRLLIAHELTHVLQQKVASPNMRQRQCSTAFAPIIQRQTAVPAPAPDSSQGGSWNAPENFGAITDRGAARVVLGEMLKEVEGYKDFTVGDVPQQRLATYNAIDREKAKLTGEAALTTAEANDLNALTLIFNAFVTSARAAIANWVRTGLGGLLNPPGMDEVYASIAEAQHALFKQPDEDKLEKVKDAVERVKGIAGKAKWVADQALKITTDVEKAEKIFEISEKLEGVNGVLEELLNIKQIGDDLLKLASQAGGGDSILGGADAVEAGVDIAGLIGKPFMKAVPLFGDYWDKYLVPLTKKCCSLLRKIEDMADKINRDEMGDAFDPKHPSPTPPELPARVYLTFEGGREVFEYLYLTRFAQQPSMSPYVEKVIMKHREMLEKSTGDEVELEESHWYNPLTWFNRKAKDLPSWVASHITDVWASFYGSAGL